MKFIADIGANHDGNLQRAIDLIVRARASGANVAKFQHFQADKIVSDKGFKKIGKTSHQSGWKGSVFDTYKKYSLSPDWTPILKGACDDVGIEFMSTPYDYDSADQLYDYVKSYKIGSGDITWIDFLEYIAKKGKPIILSTGASTLEDVDRAVNAILKHNSQLTLLQCNTDYTGKDFYEYTNLNVLKTYQNRYGLPVGLSDHTTDYVTVLGAIALGATVIEKHFTDDRTRKGPDHSFALDFHTFRSMVHDAHNLVRAMGSLDKFVCENEKETVIAQRRCIRASKDIKKGDAIYLKDLEALRPCEEGAIEPYQICRK